jgi:hypothetical protein
MVVIPPREARDFLLADGANPVLLLPEVQQFPPPLQGFRHFEVEPTLKIGFPGWVVGVRWPLDFRMPLNGHTAGEE